MLTANERLARIRVKIERAKHHISDLEIAIRAFLDSRPYVIDRKPDDHIARITVYYLKTARETPSTLAAIVGDVLNNLRAALDHLTYHLVEVNHGILGKQTYFPIFSSAASYKTGAPGKVKGMGPLAIKAINAVEPYDGGHGAVLWTLHQLNNIDKHRLLITVGASLSGVSITPMFQQALAPEIKPFFMRPDVHICPLKAGNELTFRVAGLQSLAHPLNAYEVNENVQFTFEIAFGEPGIAEREPVIETLTQMVDFVDNLILSFKPLLV